MAYSDYGAFVYRNSVRQREYEDVTLSELVDGGDPDIEFEEPRTGAFADTFDRLEYGIIGEDGTYAFLHRWGFYATQVVHIAQDEDGRLIVDDAISPGKIRDVLLESGAYHPDKATDADDKVDVLYDTDTKWSLGIDFHGWHLTLDNNGGDSIYENGYPDHCSMERDGARWDCYFGPAYGAGLLDVLPADEHRFDRLDADHKPSRVNYVETMLYDGVYLGKKRYVRLSRLVGDGLAMRMATYDTPEGCGDCVDCVFNDDEHAQSEYLSQYVNPYDAAKLINLGITIGKCGYDGIKVDDIGQLDEHGFCSTLGDEKTMGKSQVKKALGIQKMSEACASVSHWVHDFDDNHQEAGDE